MDRKDEMRIATTEDWLFCPEPNPTAKLRLACFPYAGGRSSVFSDWHRYLPPEIELCCVQLPGRDAKRFDPPFTHFASLISALAQGLRATSGIPVAFFGHSMGALIIFELAREFRRQRLPGPVHLFVSGHRGPQCSDPEEPIHNLPDGQFVHELQRRYGETEDFLQSPELVELFLPLLRADFSVCETYIYRWEEPLDCPISAFGGSQDRKVTRHHLLTWRMHTRGPFNLRIFPGDHFYLRNTKIPLVQALSRQLTQIIRRVPHKHAD
jgi:medium-chain acyl-[acyl-carrier-protein] hydrolase